MKLATLLALSATASAHTVFTTFYVDGVSLGDGTGVRMGRDPPRASRPIRPDNDAMACGWDGETANPRAVAVANGATISFEFRAWANDPSKGAIAPGHKGPCSIYLKRVDNSAADNTAKGDGWFKIWEEGYDEDEGTWCTTKLGGEGQAGPYNQTLSVALPKGLQGGYYLARPELLALHAAQDGDPQFYTGCAQIFLESDGNLVPKTTVSIPGHVKMSDPSVTFNLYKDPLPLPYSMPGPALAELVAGSVSAVKEQTEGLEPAGCILENAGFCAHEVADYSTEAGCWDAAKECWDQNDACWKYAQTLPTTGDPWCKLWGKKCEAINDACKAKNFKGPVNKSTVITPPAPVIEVVMPKGKMCSSP